jgi:hypothetical protein
MYVFKAPVITWPGYEDAVADLKGNVNLYRLASAKDIQEKMASDYEAMLYIHTATFVNPIGEPFLSIYFDLFRKYHGDEIADSIGLERKELSEYDMSHLKRLKSWIYRTQMENLKPLLKESREKRTPGKEEYAATLFDFMGGGTT